MSEAPRCLLLHGFTSSLDTVSLLADRLRQMNWEVSVPTLRGHGTRPENLLGVKAEEWYRDAETALLKLTADGRPAMIAGLSMGGVVAFDLGIRQRERVAAVAALAPSFRFRSKLVYLLPLMQMGFKFWGGSPQYADAERAKLDTNYPFFPLGAFAELYHYAHTVRRQLKQFDRPLLLLQSRQDSVVKPSLAPKILDEVGSTDKRLVWFERTKHAMLQDLERDAVASSVVFFFQEQASLSLRVS